VGLELDEHPVALPGGAGGCLESGTGDRVGDRDERLGGGDRFGEKPGFVLDVADGDDGGCGDLPPGVGGPGEGLPPAGAVVEGGDTSLLGRAGVEVQGLQLGEEVRPRRSRDETVVEERTGVRCPW
jgi:hypothetical protein